MQDISVSWSKFKAFKTANDLTIQCVISTERYHLFLFKDNFQVSHIVDRIESEELTDFETNLMGDSNIVIDLSTEE